MCEIEQTKTQLKKGIPPCSVYIFFCNTQAQACGFFVFFLHSPPKKNKKKTKKGLHITAFFAQGLHSKAQKKTTLRSSSFASSFSTQTCSKECFAQYFFWVENTCLIGVPLGRFGVFLSFFLRFSAFYCNDKVCKKKLPKKLAGKPRFAALRASFSLCLAPHAAARQLRFAPIFFACGADFII